MEALRFILRHTDIRMTQRYVHLLKDDIMAIYPKKAP
jgi:site-specific recombinase XerD